MSKNECPKTIFRDFLGFCSKKIPIPGIWDFSGFWLRDFSGQKKDPKSPGFGIWELGSQKNPIPKPPLMWADGSVRGIFGKFVLLDRLPFR